jgi:hypothetical protein
MNIIVIRKVSLWSSQLDGISQTKLRHVEGAATFVVTVERTLKLIDGLVANAGETISANFYLKIPVGGKRNGPILLLHDPDLGKEHVCARLSF